MSYFPVTQPEILVLCFTITLVAGFVKGAVGFAMPMIMISGMGSFIAPDVALAALIVPTVAANLFQAFRGGFTAAVQAAKDYRAFIGIILVFIAISAQLVSVISAQQMYLLLGIPVTFFALSQLLGWHIAFRPEHRLRYEVILGTVAGLIGGVSGVWGPPTVAYLTALKTPKTDQLRVQGVVYGAGALVLLLAHLKSGVLNAQTLPFSLVMLVPALAGLWVGFRFHDRMDQERFRMLTLIVLVVAGLNLIRRGLLG